MIDTASYVLPLPSIPSAITEPADRASFLADHYWDNMDWNDTLLLSCDRFMGESMATYGTLLNIAPLSKATSAVNALVNRVASNHRALNTLADYAYSYFYYPGAPLYDEETYLLFLNPMLAQKGIPDEEWQRMRLRKDNIMKNRKGSVATDFRFIGTDGKTHNLHSMLRDTPYNLLMLYDPDCEVCGDAISIITASGPFTEAQREGVVKVIAINPFGQEQGGPALRKNGIPEEWITGYSPDGEMDKQEIYAIRATPAIYVLDSEGHVLHKDLSINNLADFVNASSE